MARKSHKVGRWHHTASNRRNVLRNGGGRKNYWKIRERNERRKLRRKNRRAIENILLFILFLTIIISLGLL